MPFWQFFKEGWDGCVLLVQPSISAHRKWPEMVVSASTDQVHWLPKCLGWQAISLIKMAPGEVGVWLPWWCPTFVLPAPGSWGLFLNLILFSYWKNDQFQQNFRLKLKGKISLGKIAVLIKTFNFDLKFCWNYYTYMKVKFDSSDGRQDMLGRCSNSLVNMSILNGENAIFATLTSKQASNFWFDGNWWQICIFLFFLFKEVCR